MIRDYRALAAYQAARRARPMEWGSRANDCASHADGGWVAQGGRSIIRELKLHWATPLGAARVLKRVGGLAAALDRSKQLKRVPLSLARRGDIGLVEGSHGAFLVLIDGDTVSGPGPDAATILPRALLLAAWGPAQKVSG